VRSAAAVPKVASEGERSSARRVLPLSSRVAVFPSEETETVALECPRLLSMNG